MRGVWVQDKAADAAQRCADAEAAVEELTADLDLSVMAVGMETDKVAALEEYAAALGGDATELLERIEAEHTAAQEDSMAASEADSEPGEGPDNSDGGNDAVADAHASADMAHAVSAGASADASALAAPAQVVTGGPEADAFTLGAPGATPVVEADVQLERAAEGVWPGGSADANGVEVSDVAAGTLDGWGGWDDEAAEALPPGGHPAAPVPAGDLLGLHEAGVADDAAVSSGGWGAWDASHEVRDLSGGEVAAGGHVEGTSVEGGPGEAAPADWGDVDASETGWGGWDDGGFEPASPEVWHGPGVAEAGSNAAAADSSFVGDVFGLEAQAAAPAAEAGTFFSEVAVAAAPGDDGISGGWFASQDPEAHAAGEHTADAWASTAHGGDGVPAAEAAGWDVQDPGWAFANSAAPVACAPAQGTAPVAAAAPEQEGGFFDGFRDEDGVGPSAGAAAVVSWPPHSAGGPPTSWPGAVPGGIGLQDDAAQQVVQEHAGAAAHGSAHAEQPLQDSWAGADGWGGDGGWADEGWGVGESQEGWNQGGWGEAGWAGAEAAEDAAWEQGGQQQGAGWSGWGAAGAEADSAGAAGGTSGGRFFA